MKHGLKPLVAAVLVTLMAGCGTQQPQYRDRYTAFTPSDAQLQDYDVGAPPVTAQAYSSMPWDAKETMWVDYTNDLLKVIGKHMADKAGLRKSKVDLQEKIDDLNKKAGNTK
jgi:predicted small lipoprotein YifL